MRKPLTRKSKNKLSIKQQSNVDNNVEKNLNQLIEQSQDIDNVQFKAGLVISHKGFHAVIDIDGQLLLADWRQHIGHLCAGDNVIVRLDDNVTAVIEALLPRRNVIEKQNVYRGSKPFAANIDQIIVIVTHQPMFQPSLLDRYLITAELVGIDCLVFFNKIDILVEPNDIDLVNKYEEIYSNLSKVIWVKGSVKTGFGLDVLLSKLDNKKTVITGQSGVGKSSLINKLIPNLNIQTCAISDISGLGKHSTTNSTLYRLGENGILIDTPGVRSFDTYHLTRGDIERGYVEIFDYIGKCHFSNCSHTHEKNCAILEAIAAGKISKLRYNQFIQTLKEIK